MKRLFTFLLSIAVIAGMTSCAQEDISTSVITGEEVVVSFTTSLKDASTRTFGQGENVDKLYFNVYDAVNGDKISHLSSTTTTTTPGKFTFQLTMVKGMKYDIVFWAQNSNCLAYTVNDDKSVVVDYTKIPANDDTADAFFGFVPSFDPVTATDTTFELTRPFAQLNAATADFDYLTNSGISNLTSTVAVEAHNTFDIVSGDVVGSKVNVEFDATAIPSEAFYKAGYTYLSMNYLLAPKASTIANTTFTFSGTKNGNDVVIPQTSYANIPLQQNYRTNILGELLTKEVEFTVEILPAFTNGTGTDVNIVSVSDAQDFVAAIESSVAQSSTEIVLNGDVDLNELFGATLISTRAGADNGLTIPAGKNITINLNGFTLSHSKNQTDNYSMIINDGNLTITGEGAIEYTDLGQGGEYISNTILNRGTITVKGGATIKNLSSKTVGQNGYPYVIDSSIWGSASEVVTNIEGGKLYSEGYSALRLRADSATKPVIINITEGEVVGTIEVQLPASVAGLGALNITGGKISNNATANAIYVFGANGDASNLSVNINDATVVGNIKVRESVGRNFNSKFIHKVALTNLTSAFDFLADGAVIAPASDLVLTETLNIPAGKNIVLDLAGKTISGTDSTTASYSLISNGGTLTVDDTVGGGKISLSSENNRGWNAYSSVISNTVGGKLVINNGTIEHLGGTDMAYAIDNLTNGNGTAAVTTINGGTVASKYIAVRQFINGANANNTLTINGGTLLSTGSKYSIFFQDPSGGTVLNSGNLVISKDAAIEHNIYLRATPACTVSIASAALKNGATIVTDNCSVVETDGIWTLVANN